nr:putative reverse transcriptase domain-containing protein [Tanacetum cinerariifolium]
MANTENTNRNTKVRETPVVKRGNYKEFISCQPFYFNGTKRAIGLICWFERAESVFSHSNCVEKNKVTFATGTLTDDALSWWNAYAQPIRIEQANKITWTELEKLLTNKVGHLTKNCRNKGPTTGRNQQPVSVICHAYEEKGHYNYQCSKANNNAHGRAYLLRDKNAHQDPNVVTDTTYDIKMAMGNLVGTNTVIQGCTLTLLNQHFKIDFIPIKLGSFNVVIRMDCLSKHHARIISDEKVFRILIDGETLIIQGRACKSPEDNFGITQKGRIKLCEAPILALPEGNDDFVVYCDASHQGTQLNMSTAYHPETDRQSERTIQILEDMLRAYVIDFGKGWEKHLPLVEFSYNNSYHASIEAASFEALYGQKCRSPVCWAEVRDVQLTGP